MDLIHLTSNKILEKMAHNNIRMKLNYTVVCQRNNGKNLKMQKRKKLQERTWEKLELHHFNHDLSPNGKNQVEKIFSQLIPRKQKVLQIFPTCKKDYLSSVNILNVDMLLTNNLFYAIKYRQRKGGKPDDSDLKGNKGGFSFFGKKKEPEPEAPPEPEKKNWWTL